MAELAPRVSEVVVEAGRRPRLTVQAADLREALLSQPGETLSQAAAGISFPLTDATIEGTFDLRHCCIGKPVEIRRCHFVDDVDLRYSEFTQVVDLADCHFYGRVNSGDLKRARTIYRKDVICDGATFHGAVGFNGAHVEGSASFAGSTFPSLEASDIPVDQDVEADFTSIHCGKAFDCSRAVFKGGASFNALRAEIGYFCCARFEHPDQTIDFTGAIFATNLELSDPREDDDGADDDAPCPVVAGPLLLRGLRCGAKAIFRGTRFGGCVDCEHADFGQVLNCRRTWFDGHAIFARTRCGSAGRFEGAYFGYDQRPDRADADFRYACFGSLEFTQATVWGGIALGQARIDEKLHLSEACFCEDVLLYAAKIETIVLLSDGHTFEWLSDTPPASGPAARSVAGTSPATAAVAVPATCGEHRRLLRQRHEEVRRAHLERLRQSIIRARQQTRTTEDLRQLLRHRVRNPLARGWIKDLRKAAGDYYFPYKGDIKPLRADGKSRGVEFAGCTFNRVTGGRAPELGNELACRFVRSQKPDRFSRDAYLQLEGVYQRAGNEYLARSAHLMGHKELRKNARREDDGAVEWSWWQGRKDDILWLTGWGLQTWKVALVCLVFFVAATLLFAVADDSLRQETTVVGSRGVASAGGLAMAIGAQDPTEPQSTGGCGDNDWSCWWRTAAYSLDVFLPAVDLGVEDRWQPARGWLESVEIALILSGWFLVPLSLASAAGFIKGD